MGAYRSRSCHITKLPAVLTPLQLFLYHCFDTTVLIPLFWYQCFDTMLWYHALIPLFWYHCFNTTVLIPLFWYHCFDTTLLTPIFFFRGYSKNSTTLEADLVTQSPYIKAAFAVLALGIASLVNVISSDLGDKVNQIFAVIKVSAISVICCIGIYWLAKGFNSVTDTSPVLFFVSLK